MTRLSDPPPHGIQAVYDGRDAEFHAARWLRAPERPAVDGPPFEHGGGVGAEGVALGGDPLRLVIWGRGRVTVWDVPGARVELEVHVAGKLVRAEISPDGRRLDFRRFQAKGDFRGGQNYAVDLAERRWVDPPETFPNRRPEPDPENEDRLAITPDEACRLSRIWDTPMKLAVENPGTSMAPRLVELPRRVSGTLYSAKAAVDPGGEVLAVAGCGVVYLRSVRDPGAALPEPPGYRWSRSLVYSPEGTPVLAARQRLMELGDGEPRELGTYQGKFLWALATGPMPGGWLMAVDSRLGLLEAGQEPWWKTIGSVTRPVRTGTVSRDGTRLAWHVRGPVRPELRVWDTVTRHQLLELRVENMGMEVADMALAEGGEILVASFGRGTAAFSLPEGEELWRSSLGASGRAACVSPDRSLVALRPRDGPPRILLLEARTGARVHELMAGEVPPWALGFLPDGTGLVASYPDRRLVWFDLRTGQPRLEWTTPGRPVTELVANPDGTRLAGAAEDDSVVEWDLEELRERAGST